MGYCLLFDFGWICWNFIIFAAMKSYLSIGLIFGLALLAACTSTTKVPEPVEGPSPELCAVDSLMWRQPDSALAVLMDYLSDDGRDGACTVSNDIHCDTKGDGACTVSTDEMFDNHYANLLLAELLYKNDYAQTNRAELQQAVSYFDSLTSTLNDHPHASWRHGGLEPPSPERNDNLIFLDARAHYINGVGYYENDSMVEACKEYLKALEVMEGRFGEKEMVGNKAIFMAFTYTRLAGLFSDLYLHEQAIYFSRCSMTYYKKPNMPSWYIARILNEIGSQYDMMEQSDTATYYYRKAMDALDDTTTLMYRDIASHMICLEYNEGICKVDLASQRLRQLLQNSESDRERQARCLNIGELFYNERKYDSAWVYLNTVFQTTTVTGLKRQAAEWLAEICKVQGRADDILEYASFLVPFANQEENQSAIKSELTERYKAFGQARLNREHQKEMRKQFHLALSVVFGLLTMMLIFGLLYRKNKRGKKHLETLIETERNAHKIQQAALSGRLKRSNASLKEKEKMKYTNDKPINQNHYNQAENYLDEPICRRILSICNDENNPIKSSIPVSSYANFALTDAQKVELKKAAFAHYAPLFDMLKRQYPELKEKDFQYFYLCLLGLDNAQIAVMTQLSYRTIWEREKRLQCIFHKEERISILLNEMMTN